MENKNLKKGIIFSLLIIAVCVVTIVGTSYAWFTDTASTSGNKIQAGTLDIKLEKSTDGTSWVDAEGQPLNLVKAEGHENEKIYFEPGATYKLETIKVTNNGNLALKYKIVLNGLTGDAKLLDVLDITIDGQDGSINDLANQEFHLAAGKASDPITISLRMAENAGNEYQGMTLSDVSIKVIATQDTVESDSFGNQYDAGATYPTDDQVTGE